MIRRLVCWLFGHKWVQKRIIRQTEFGYIFIPMHCTRCLAEPPKEDRAV